MKMKSYSKNSQMLKLKVIE